MKKAILIIIPIVALLIAIIFSGAQTADEEQEIIYYSSRENLASYLLENEYLKLEMAGDTGYFTLTDKNTGEVYTSVPEGASSDPMAQSSVRNTMQSPVLVTYSDQAGNSMTYDAYTYAIKDGTFQILQEDNKIIVNYMVGPSVRFYVVPEAISKERFDAIKEVMDSIDPDMKQVVVRNYRRLDITKYKDEDERAELLEMMPMLEDGIYYALPIATGGDALPRYIMEEIEAAFLAAGYTEEEALADAMGNVDYSDVVQFNLTVEYSLDGDALVVEVPEEKISYPVEHPMTEIRVLPYFCSAGDGDEGYLLVPDGGGGQIFFHNGKTNYNNYYTNVYGWDEVMARDTRIQDNDAMFPVFGIAKNDRYILAVAEGGAAELGVEADIAGKWSSYDYVCPVFKISHGDRTTTMEKSGSTIYVYQETPLVENLSVRYFFGDSDSYVDMAERYREYLCTQNENFAQITETGIPLLVELVGAIDRSEKILGVPVRQTYAATDYTEAKGIVKSLSAVENLNIRYSAVLNGGMDQTALLSANRVNALGSEKERQAFLEAIQNSGANLYISGYAQLVMKDTWFNSFTNAARDTSNVAAKSYPYYQNMQIQTELADDLIYMLDMPSIEKAVGVLTQEAGEWNGAGVGFADLGDILYSDFSKTNGSSRDEMRRQQMLLLKDLSNQGNSILIAGGNDYAAISADLISDMLLAGGGYDIVDRHVPFYQIALHGYVSYTGSALNAAGDYQTALLQAVETGAGLNFVFFETDYQEIVGSRYTYQTDLYSANFASWQDELTQVYQRLNSELGHTVNQTITDHCYLTDFVTVTRYADGTAVYVNYGDSDYVYEGLTIPGRDWAAVKGE